MTRTRAGATLDGKELLVKRFCHLLAYRPPVVCLTAPLFHQLYGADDVGRRYQRDIGLAIRVFRVDELQLLGRHAPVGIFTTMDDTFPTVFVDDVRHPFLDGGVTVVDRLAVTKLAPQHIAAEGQCCRPRHVVAVVVPEGRSHVRDATIRTLCLADVTHPLGIEAFVVEEVAFA